VNVPVYHTPALCREAVDLLMTDAGGSYVDGTVGGGGHAQEICTRLRGHGRLLCLDADDEALTSARTRLAGFAERTFFVRTNFRFLREAMQTEGWTHTLGILLDLGVSSHQIDAVERGFTFRGDERLDMRMDRRQPLSAWDVVNTYDERSLATIIYRFGEEQNARRIARSLAGRRPVNTTGELRDVVAALTPERFLNKSLARVFQALRIEVNGELDSLRTVLADARDLLAPGGRIVVISYHSLEDRIVKDFFRSESTVVWNRDVPMMPGQDPEPLFQALTRKPVVPSDQEISDNPRARSAKMRAAERRYVGTQGTK
jgi:16S rRNA (cytosine1402-N4)-methyltransferase